MEELYKKDLNDWDNHDGVITHLVTDILASKVKSALEHMNTNKASAGDGTAAELFQVLKDDNAKVLHLISQQIWKVSSGLRKGKGQFSFQSQRTLKLLHNFPHFKQKQRLKILQVRL